MMAMTITLDLDPVVLCFTITGAVAILFGKKWWKERK